MRENKTKPTNKSVDQYIAQIEDDTKRADAKLVLKMMEEVTGAEPLMWGPSIVGFGSYHYRYDSGREGDSLKVGFAARKQALVLYGLVFYDQNHANNLLLGKLGLHKRGKGCLYIKKLQDINTAILEQMISNSFNDAS